MEFILITYASEDGERGFLNPAHIEEAHYTEDAASGGDPEKAKLVVTMTGGREVSFTGQAAFEIGMALGDFGYTSKIFRDDTTPAEDAMAARR